MTKINKPVEPCLSQHIEKAMKTYLKDLEGHPPIKLYSLFIEEVERPFFKVVMEYVKGNISHAAQLLGVNRATLKKRLDKYNICD